MSDPILYFVTWVDAEEILLPVTEGVLRQLAPGLRELYEAHAGKIVKLEHDIVEWTPPVQEDVTVDLMEG